MTTPLPEDVRAALQQGRKVDAIRLLRGHTGLGLAEAKAAVEAGALPAAVAHGAKPTKPPTEIPADAMAALARGDTIGAIHAIHAIHAIRHAHGIGLKDAKAVVDAARRSGAAPRRPGLAPGEVPRRRWPWLLGLVVAVVALALWAGVVRAADAPAGQGTSTTSPAPRIALPPHDDAARNPEFFAFRARLQAALARRDVAAVERLLHPQVKLSFGGDAGLEGFRRLWAPEAPDTRLWATLAEVLALGGRFDADGAFTAPYVFTDFPDTADPYDAVAVVGHGVRLRAAPSADAPVVGAATFEVLATDHRAPQAEGWTAVRVGGQRAWIDDRFVRSPIDYRVRFARRDGGWRIEFFLAGD